QTALLFLNLCVCAHTSVCACASLTVTESREKRSVPNWALTSSDFFAWIEELRSHAGYDKIEELARTFWAHFPSASRLGYDPPAPEE
uniref:Si:ch73-23l24.1 n=1 Tax=Sinocyclocheilus rhinocerous TaxID=307959 RepID=A0A673JIF5_9TELE